MTPHENLDPLLIGSRSFASRLLVGTGKYKEFAETKAAEDALRTPVRQGVNRVCSTPFRRRNTRCCPTPPAATAPTTQCAPCALHASCSTATTW